jgi:hypothetical protein
MRILNLGAGVQSTTIFLMAKEGAIPPIDHAIFADTQKEPEAVYHHLTWLRSLQSPPAPHIHITSTGRLGDHLLKGQNSTGGLFATIPAYTAKHHSKRINREPCNEGMIRRQCTKEYKVEVVERHIRRVILGLKPRHHIPKGTKLQQLFGISLDEKHRTTSIRERVEKTGWAIPTFPLIDLKMKRDDCLQWLKDRVPHKTPRSACVFCPFKSAQEWLSTKANPRDWKRAVEIDEGIRRPGAVVNRNLHQTLYLHRSCLPLVQIDFEALAKKEQDKKATPLFSLLDCGQGMCGV